MDQECAVGVDHSTAVAHHTMNIVLEKSDTLHK